MLAYLDDPALSANPARNGLRQNGMQNWPSTPNDPHAGQSPAQVEMLDAVIAAWDGIYDMANNVLSPRILEIRFSDNTVYWINRGYTSYYLKNLAVKARFLGDDDSHYLCLDQANLHAVAVFGYGALTNKPQGFLLTQQDGKDVIYELEEFCVGASVDNDPSDPWFEEWEPLDNERVFFTCFNKTRELLLVETPKTAGGLFDGCDGDGPDPAGGGDTDSKND